MSSSAISMFVFGIYVILLGMSQIFIPNKILPILKLPPTDEPWIRVLGVILAILGFYYMMAAQHEITIFFWATIIGRFGVLIGFVLLVLFKKAKPVLIIFGVIDTLGAIWTMVTM